MSQTSQPSLAALGDPPPYTSTVDLARNRPALPDAHRNPFLQACTFIWYPFSARR